MYNRKEIEEIILGQNYYELSNILKLLNIKVIYRPIIFNNIKLYKDDFNDQNRCNIIVNNNIVSKIDGWY
jgi:hypothetical protein